MKPSFLLMAGLILAPTIGVGSSAMAAPQGNLLSNGDFEKGFDGWEARSGLNSEAYKLAQKADAFKGNGAAIMTVGDSTAADFKKYSYFSRGDLPAEPGYYRFSFAVRHDLKTGNAGPYIFVQDAGGKLLLSLRPGQRGAPLLEGRQGWKEYSFIYRIPANAKKSILQFQMDNATGTVALDEVKIEKLDDATGKRLMSQQTNESVAHNEYGAKLLGQPCRNVNALKGILYPDPKTGRQLLVINSCTSVYNGAGIFVDYETGETTVTQLPNGSGGWDVIDIGDNKLLFESLEPLHLITVDTTTRQVVGDVAVPQSSYGWRFARSKDGWVYFGSYPSCHAYRYNIAIKQVEDLGRMGPEGNTYVRFVGLTGDGWLLSSVMSEKSGVVAYNIATKQQQMVEGITTSPTIYTVGDVVYTALDGKLLQFDTATLKFVDVTIPAPEGVKWTGMLDTSTPERFVLRGSDGVWYLVEQGKPAKQVWNAELRGGALVGVDNKGRVIGKRGQDYFVAEPLAKEIIPRQMTQEAPPGNMHFIRADPEGGITGGPSFGQTLFRFDPARKLQQNTGQVVDGGGEVYDGRWIDGKFYFVAYSGGDLAVWDPKEPWDQWNKKNPKPLVAYNVPEYNSLIRPQGGLTIGPQGRLYSGWSASYGTVKGGFTEYDIKTGKARSWSSDLIAPEVSIGSVAADDKYLYGVTSNHFNGMTRPAKPLIFWAFDPATEKVVFQQTLEGAKGDPKVCYVPGTKNIWVASNTGVQRFDRDTLKFAEKLSWPSGAGRADSVDAHDAQGNRAWFAAENTIVELRDGKTPGVKALFTTPNGIQSLTANGDQLYYTQQTEVWAAPLTKE